MTAFAEKHYPDMLMPEDLDAYLARGWYRMGQTIFTTHFLCFGDRFYSAIWVRLPLANYQFNKRQRRLLRRNGQLFTLRCRPATITPEKEQLFQRYKASFSGMLAPSLRDSLLDGEEFNIFSTYETAIYEGNKLIGLSFFDLGRHSAASIMGIYDPAYSNYSLGYYTMLQEIEYCLQQRLDYYYPGYVVPGYQRFDYKLRIGPVEFLDLRTDSWLTYNELSDDRIPLGQMEAQLYRLQQALGRQGLRTHLKHYPLFEANLFGFWNAPYFDYPILLECQLPRRPSDHYWLIVFDVRQQCYQLLQCSLFDDLQFYFNESYTDGFDRRRFFMELVVVDTVFLRHTDPSAMAGMLQQIWPRLAT